MAESRGTVFCGWLDGWMLSTPLAYGLSFFFRRISFTAMLLLIVLLWSVAVFLWLPDLKRWREDDFHFNWQPDYGKVLKSRFMLPTITTDKVRTSDL